MGLVQKDLTRLEAAQGVSSVQLQTPCPLCAALPAALLCQHIPLLQSEGRHRQLELSTERGEVGFSARCRGPGHKHRQLELYKSKH